MYTSLWHSSIQASNPTKYTYIHRFMCIISTYICYTWTCKQGKRPPAEHTSAPISKQTCTYMHILLKMCRHDTRIHELRRQKLLQNFYCVNFPWNSRETTYIDKQSKQMRPTFGTCLIYTQCYTRSCLCQGQRKRNQMTHTSSTQTHRHMQTKSKNTNRYIHKSTE